MGHLESSSPMQAPMSTSWLSNVLFLGTVFQFRWIYHENFLLILTEKFDDNGQSRFIVHAEDVQ